MTTFPRRTYSGGARALKLKAPITATATTMTATGNFATWPTGAAGHFTITVTEGFAEEEKMTISAFSRSSGQFTIHERGFDKTPAVGHVPQTGTNPEQIKPTWSAVEATQANAVVHTVNTIQGVTATKIPYVKTTGGTKRFTYKTATAVFSLNTTSGLIAASGNISTAGLSTDHTAAKATHQHKSLVVTSGANKLHGTISGQDFWFQVASKTVTTDSSGRAIVTLPSAFPNGLIAAWALNYTTGVHAGYLYTIDKSTCTNSRVCVSLTERTGTAVQTFSVHVMVLAVGC